MLNIGNILRSESRWKRSRTQSSPPPTNNPLQPPSKKKSTRRTSIEYLLNTGRRPQTPPKGRKTPILLGRTKGNKKREKREKKGIRTGPELLGGIYEREKESTHWEDP